MIDILNTVSVWFTFLISLLVLFSMISNYRTIRKSKKEILHYAAEIEKYRKMLEENNKIVEENIAEQKKVLTMRIKN